MKLKYRFEDVDMGEEIISVPVGANADQVKGVLKQNSESREILNLLINDITEDELVATLAMKYENDRSELVNYVHSVISTLRDADLLEF